MVDNLILNKGVLMSKYVLNTINTFELLDSLWSFCKFSFVIIRTARQSKSITQAIYSFHVILMGTNFYWLR